jgi:glyoxylase-like metal-dependent hydrolase (beta-lactamase superfamily II)
VRDAYDWIDHGGGVYSRRYQSLDLNIGVVVCGDGALLVDTRAHHRQAEELLHDLKRVTPHPVRWVANTHHHWDHTFGNGALTPVPIWGHERCAEALRRRGDRMRREAQEWFPGQAGLFAEVVITPPDRTFSREATLTLDGRVVELHHLGRGHTDNDIVVAVPDAGVVFAGDLIEESSPPYFQDSYPLEWPDTVVALLEMAQGPVVPGHGAVVDRTFVAAQHQDLAEVARLAEERHADGMSAVEAAAAGGPYPREVLEAAFARVWPGLELGR